MYLKVFEEAFTVYKPASLMTAYNGVNGVFCAENGDMLQGIFEKEFGFDGFVMTDWTSSDTCDIVKAVDAGNDLIATCETAGYPIVLQAVNTGRISENRVNESVIRILAYKLYYGLMS